MYTTDQIRSLIQAGKEKDFYKSYAWQQAAAMARKLQNNECQRCKARGFYSACQIVHHKKPLKQRPDLAYDQGNLECLCLDCHNEEHMGKAAGTSGYMNEERW